MASETSYLNVSVTAPMVPEAAYSGESGHRIRSKAGTVPANDGRRRSAAVPRLCKRDYAVSVSTISPSLVVMRVPTVCLIRSLKYTN